MTNLVGGQNAVACRSCYTFSGNGMALNPSIKYGHLQVEFGGEVQFNGDSSPFDYIEHTGGSS